MTTSSETHPPHGAPTPGTVLRGVPVESHVHALRSSARANQAGAADAAPALAHCDASAGRVAAAFAAGRSEGLNAGREEGATHERQRLQRLVEEARRAAHEEGLQEGRDRGLREGREIAAREAQTIRATATADTEAAADHFRSRTACLLQQLVASSEQWLHAQEDEIVTVAFAAVCEILGEQAASADSLREMVSRLLAQHGARSPLELLVHPQDYELVSGQEDARGWRWKPDASVKVGGVVLRSPQGSLDARLETQLAGLRDALMSARKRRAGQAAAGFRTRGVSQ